MVCQNIIDCLEQHLHFDMIFSLDYKITLSSFEVSLTACSEKYDSHQNEPNAAILELAEGWDDDFF